MRNEKNAQLKAALADLDAKRVAVMKTAGLAGKDKQRAQAEEDVRKVGWVAATLFVWGGGGALGI